MSKVTTTGIKTSQDLKELAFTGQAKGFKFTGSTLPTTLEIGILDEADNFSAFTDGAITTLGQDLIVDAMPGRGLALNVNGGSPDFIITAMVAGPLSQ